MNEYPSNPCITCCERTVKKVTVLKDGVFETVNQSFCSKKKIFTIDRNGPCKSYKEASE